MSEESDKFADAVDKARLRMWTEHGVQLQFDVEQFAGYLSDALGMNDARPSDPQPATEFVSEVGTSAEIVAEVKHDENEHEFRVDRGGVNCITCDMPEAEGNHTS